MLYKPTGQDIELYLSGSKLFLQIWLRRREKVFFWDKIYFTSVDFVEYSNWYLEQKTTNRKWNMCWTFLTRRIHFCFDSSKLTIYLCVFLLAARLLDLLASEMYFCNILWSTLLTYKPCNGVQNHCKQGANHGIFCHLHTHLVSYNQMFTHSISMLYLNIISLRYMIDYAGR